MKWPLIVLSMLVLLAICAGVPYFRETIFIGNIQKIDNSQAVDVSYAELMEFLDNCHAIQIDEPLSCADYAGDLHNEAEARGIRAAIVLVHEKGLPLFYFHAINAFNTTDKGMVYVDAGLGYAHRPCPCGIAEKIDGVYVVNLKVAEIEKWYGSYSKIEPQYVTETLGDERGFIIFW
jgi:hypothetical protein